MFDRTVRSVHEKRSRALRIEMRRLLGTNAALAIAALLASGCAVAQETTELPSGIVAEVTVTGTRVQREGYDAPTPVSVLGIEQLRASPTTNLADSVVRLPALSGSTTSHNQASDLSSGTAGANLMNLRGLGSARTLVLMNGKRMVSAGLPSNAVDVSSIPSALVERVEVVTGGASAAYGSDALAGVVNFILDDDFTGFKANVEGGITDEGDGENYKASLTGGTGFADGRGHSSFSFEFARNEMIRHNVRSWGETSYQTVANPAYNGTNGQPRYLNIRDAGPAVFTDGGLIVGCTVPGGGACPLRGTQFVEGGAVDTFQFGNIAGALMTGGDWEESRVDQLPSLTLGVKRYAFFGQSSFDLTDNVTAYGELQWSSTRSTNPSQLRPFDTGLTIQADNAFLPASVRQQMTALGITSFTLGTSNADLPMSGGDHTREFRRYVGGFKGSFDMGGSDWAWDTSIGRSEQHIDLRAPSSRVTSFYRTALDSVVGANGQIQCRVNTDANPANDAPGCVPYNVMGTGVNSEAAVGYVIRSGRATTLLAQNVASVSLAGEPFSTWAGGVSVAVGADYRRESVEGTASALDEANSFFAGNWHATRGDYNVKEGFFETVVPLARDLPAMQELDFNGAVRWTDYSTSGEVTTWKLGATWSLIDDVRVRLTRSRDIRAPSLGELFNAGQSGTTNIYDPVRNVTRTTQSVTSGNPNLSPEEADTTGVGIVFTPTFLPGFAASLDYYSIDITGSIATLGGDFVVRRCAEGVTSFCSFITRDAAGFVSFINNAPQNILGQKATGYDLEMSYRLTFDSLPGQFAFRALGTYFDKLETRDVGGLIQGANVNAPSMAIGNGNALSSPKYRYLLSGTYALDPATVVLTMRGISAGKYNNAFIECSTDCPAGNVNTINDNSIGSIQYFDLSLNYQAFDGGEVYFAVENFLDKDPPLIAGRLGTGFIDGQANGTNYDRLGRQFRVGMRVDF